MSSSRCLICGTWTSNREVRFNIIGPKFANSPEETLLKQIVGEIVVTDSSPAACASNVKVYNYLCRPCHTKLSRISRLDIQIKEGKLEKERSGIFTVLCSKHNAIRSVAPTVTTDTVQHIPVRLALPLLRAANHMAK